MKKLLYSSLAVMVVGVVFASSPGTAEAVKHKVPRTETYDATEITSTSAMLNGWVRGIQSGPGHAWFEYGTNPYSGNYQTSWPYKAGVRGINSHTAEKIWVKVSNLKPNTTYYYRVIGENNWGSNPANIKSFKTLPAHTPKPSPAPTQTHQPSPSPVSSCYGMYPCPTPYYYYPPIYFSPVFHNNNYNQNYNHNYNRPSSSSSAYSTTNNTNTNNNSNTSTNQNQNQNNNNQNQNQSHTNNTTYPNHNQPYQTPYGHGSWYEYGN